jgi:hypothetical protein
MGYGAGNVLAMSVMVENLVLMPLTLVLAEAAHDGGCSRVVAAPAIGRVVRMPVVFAIVIGTLLAALNTMPPRVLTDLARLLADAAAPVSLFAVGGSFAGASVAGARIDIVKVTRSKLLLHPFPVMPSYLEHGRLRNPAARNPWHLR